MDKAIAQFLSNHPPFNLVPFESIIKLTNEIEVRILPADHTILTYKGTPSSHLYIVYTGSVEVLRENEQGIMTVVDMLDAGDVFGHLSLIYQRPPNATIRTREETRLFLLPPEKFSQLRTDYPSFGRLFEDSQLGQLLHMFQVNDAGAHPEFRITLGEILQHPLIRVNPDATVYEIAQMMRHNQVDCIIVNSDPPGIITERDLRNRVMAEGLSYETPVYTVMTAPLITLSIESLIFEGLTFMLQHHLRHLPVTQDGEIIGIITHTDILRQQSHSPIFLPRQLTRARTIEDFKAYTRQTTETVGTLLRTEARIQDIGRVVAIAHDALLERLLRDAEAAIGPPPCPYAWLVLGSEGRYEQTLHTDQDNAIAYADNAPPEAEAYFIQLAERIVGQLEACGFPRCTGDVMATNPRWRQPLQVWKKYFDEWIHIPDEEALLQVGIFFDYRKVYGDLDIEQALRPVIQQASNNGLFLRRLSKSALRQTPPIGFFRNLVVEHDGEGRDVIDLKVRGTALIVDLARLFSLAAGRAETNTITRLQISVAPTDLSELGAEELIAAFEFLSLLRLRHQYSQFQQGIPTTNMVPVSLLSILERRELKQSLRAIANIQQSASSLFGTSFVR